MTTVRDETLEYLFQAIVSANIEKANAGQNIVKQIKATKRFNSLVKQYLELKNGPDPGLD